MKIKALKTFLFLANNQCDFSVHKLLGIPRATMWAHITEIENETSIKLINRRKQNNTLTEEGLAFVPYASKMCKIYEDGLSDIRTSQHENHVAGNLIISTTVAVSSGWLMPSIKDFHEKYPDLRVNIVANDMLTKRVENSAHVLLRPMLNTDGITRKWYTPYHHGLFASQEYLDRAGVPQTAHDLLGHCVLGYGEYEFSAFDSINWHIRGKGYNIPRLEPTLTINSTAALVKAASEGIGICSAPIETNDLYYGLVRVLPDIEGPLVKTYFCTKTNASIAEKMNLAVFEDYIRDYLVSSDVEIHDEKN